MSEITKTGILELANRVEALQGFCRELDDEIATAIYEDPRWTCIEGLSYEAGGMWMFRYPDGSVGSSLRFTGSVDAALTLIPEGWVTEEATQDYNGAEWHWCIYPEFNHTLRQWGEARTPALALTAATIRARHALALSKGSDV